MILNHPKEFQQFIDSTQKFSNMKIVTTHLSDNIPQISPQKRLSSTFGSIKRSVAKLGAAILDSTSLTPTPPLPPPLPNLHDLVVGEDKSVSPPRSPSTPTTTSLSQGSSNSSLRSH